MKEFTEKIINKLGLTSDLVLKKKIRGLPGITVYQLIESLISTNSVEEAAKYLSYTENPVKECIRHILHPLFLNRSKPFGGGRPDTWQNTLLACIEYKMCGDCATIKDYKSFIKDSSKTNGIGSRCTVCDSIRTKARKYYIAERTPGWANMEAITTIYQNCPVGFHVDHILPLRGTLVSGLHVPENLQYLSASCNLQKGNKVDLEEFNRLNSNINRGL